MVDKTKVPAKERHGSRRNKVKKRQKFLLDEKSFSRNERRTPKNDTESNA